MNPGDFYKAACEQAQDRVDSGEWDSNMVDCAKVAIHECLDREERGKIDELTGEYIDRCMRMAVKLGRGESSEEAAVELEGGIDLDKATRAHGFSETIGKIPYLSKHTLETTIEPLVKSLRCELFDNEEVPFENWGEAVEWMRDCASQARKPSPEDEKAAGNHVSKINDLVAEVEQLMGVYGEVEFSKRMIGYWTHEDTWDNLSIIGTTLKLRLMQRLATEVDSISHATGFMGKAILRYVLIGEKPPPLPRIQVDYKPGSPTRISNIYPRTTDYLPGGGTITIRFYSPNVSRKDLDCIWEAIKSRKKNLHSPGHALFLELRDEFGKSPGRRGVKDSSYWRNMLDAWNERAEDFGVDKVKNVEAIQNRERRSREKHKAAGSSL